MNEITDKLKNRIEATVPALGQQDVFDLIAAACTGCCQISNSGNGGCPPPKELSE
jgi:CO dehydrogenase/acetyl-CoA synthase alpha subunit